MGAVDKTVVAAEVKKSIADFGRTFLFCFVHGKRKLLALATSQNKQELLLKPKSPT